MKQLEDIDKLFEEGLENLEFIPNPEIKQQIQRKMFTKNFLKKFGMYILLLFFFMGTIAFFMFTDSNQFGKLNAENINSTNRVSVKIPTNNISPNTEQNKDKIRNLKKTSENKTINNEINQTQKSRNEIKETSKLTKQKISLNEKKQVKNDIAVFQKTNNKKLDIKMF